MAIIRILQLLSLHQVIGILLAATCLISINSSCHMHFSVWKRTALWRIRALFEVFKNPFRQRFESLNELNHRNGRNIQLQRRM